MSKRLSIAGHRFGALVAIKFLDASNNQSYWLYRCDCGTFIRSSAKSIKNRSGRGIPVSCGCLALEAKAKNGRANKTHGLSYHKLYDVHRQMLRRCENSDCKDYPAYGARGISVYDEWKNIRAFMNWCLSSGYRDGLTIERVDVNGDYEPSNCTWIENERQAHNTRRLHKITANGETRFIAEWARATGISRNTIYSRLRSGWSECDSVTLPVGVGAA